MLHAILSSLEIASFPTDFSSILGVTHASLSLSLGVALPPPFPHKSPPSSPHFLLHSNCELRPTLHFRGDWVHKQTTEWQVKRIPTSLPTPTPPSPLAASCINNAFLTTGPQ